MPRLFSIFLAALVCSQVLISTRHALAGDLTPLDLKRAEERHAEDKKTYEDGSLQYRVPLNAKRERQGAFTAFYPGGKKIQEKAHYENGRLSGIRERFDEKGKPVAEEAWVAGRLVCPKSVRQIEAFRGQAMKDAAAAVQKVGKLTNPNAPSAEALTRAVARLNTFRYLADVPADVGLDDSYINLCQYAAELLVKVGHLTHDPPHPDGVDDEAYRLGKDGCGRSNLFMGGDIVGSIDAFMNDSDPSNIDRLGHRRWALNPRMARTGFGGAGQFAAMYSFDGSRSEVPDYDFVCFPPRGYCPSNLFNANWAWNVSFDPAKYDVDPDAKLTIYPADTKLHRADKPLELNYEKVNKDGYGIPNTIIARPKGFAVKPNTLYEVVVTGVQTKDGKPADVSYFVSFY